MVGSCSEGAEAVRYAFLLVWLDVLSGGGHSGPGLTLAE